MDNRWHKLSLTDRFSLRRRTLGSPESRGKKKTKILEVFETSNKHSSRNSKLSTTPSQINVILTQKSYLSQFLLFSTTCCIVFRNNNKLQDMLKDNLKYNLKRQCNHQNQRYDIDVERQAI